MSPTLQGELFQSKTIRCPSVRRLGMESFSVVNFMPTFITFGTVWIDASSLNFKFGVWVKNIAGPVNIVAYAFEMASEPDGSGITVVTNEQAFTLTPGNTMWLPAPVNGVRILVNDPELVNYTGNFAAFRVGLRRAGPGGAGNDVPINLEYIGT